MCADADVRQDRGIDISWFPQPAAFGERALSELAESVPHQLWVSGGSITLALATVLLNVLLVWSSRSIYKFVHGKRLTNDDYLVWKDLVVTAFLAFLFLLLTKNEENSLRSASIYLFGGLSVASLLLLPQVIGDLIYDRRGNIKGRKQIVMANLIGFAILVAAVAFGAEVHG